MSNALWPQRFEDNPINEGETRLAYFKRLADIYNTTEGTVKTKYYRYCGEDAIHIEAEGGNNWIVVGDNYKWKCNNGVIDIPVTQIDQLFYEYSSKGLDLSGMDVRNRHNLKPWEWATIKNRLSLYKASNIFSPYTWDNTPPSEREGMVSAKMAEKFENTSQIVHSQYEKEIRKRYKDAIKESEKAKFFSRELQAELLNILPVLNDRKLSLYNHKDGLPKEHIVVAIADLHIGAEVDGLRITQRYDNEILRERLNKVADIVNSYQAKHVTLNILGDIIESFTGDMHANSWKSMAKGMYGAKVVREAVEILTDFFSRINNLYSVYCVGGNHDRPTANKNVEANGEIAELIMYILEKMYPTLSVNYNHTVVTHQSEGINYINVHGDKGHSLNKKIPELLFHHGEKSLFNLILAGHLHSRITALDGVNHRKIHCPSMFTGNQFSDDLGYSSSAGFLIIESINGLPKVVDYTLK